VEYLTRVLSALRAQSLPFEQWELLVIDNASKEPVAERFDLSWHPHGRCIRENELGLTPARLRGIAEAQSDLLVFVDDDNVLDPEYLEWASRIASESPQLGAWGGSLIAEFDEPPPEWTVPYHQMLGIRTIATEVWSRGTLSTNVALPYGAGLCVRTVLARQYATLCKTDSFRKSLDRTGDGLMSCGDLDMALCACDMGLMTGLFPQLRLIHLMPPNRLTLEYLLRIAEGTERSHLLLKKIREGSLPEIPTLPTPFHKPREWFYYRRRPRHEWQMLQSRHQGAKNALSTIEQ
jgi:glycosyltransferase involved in cell wall biosynthesis